MWTMIGAALAQDGWDAIVAEKAQPVPIGEEWSDGLGPRPARSPAARIDGASVVGGPAFGNVELAYGGRLGASPSTLGVALGASAVLYPSAEDTNVTDVRTFSVAGWHTFQRKQTRHGFGLAWYQSVGGDSGWYLRHPAEGGRRLLFTWDAYRDRDKLDWSFGAKLGGSSVFGPELTGSIAGIYQLSPQFALTAGLEIGFAPSGTGMFGLAVRPVDGLELSGGVGVRAPLFDDTLPAEAQPGVQLKGWM